MDMLWSAAAERSTFRANRPYLGETMTIIHAIFENGVFKPTEPVALPDAYSGSGVRFAPEFSSWTSSTNSVLRSNLDCIASASSTHPLPTRLWVRRMMNEPCKIPMLRKKETGRSIGAQLFNSFSPQDRFRCYRSFFTLLPTQRIPVKIDALLFRVRIKKWIP